MTSSPRWTVVVPVKGTDASKSRLDASPELALAIALDTVAAVAATGFETIVVTPAGGADVFAVLGARGVDDPGRGLNAAISAGVLAAGAGPVAVLLGDVPAMTAAELADVLRRAGSHPLAVVPDVEGSGTVLITALEAARHRPLFGPNSAAAHRAAGYLVVEVEPDSGLRRDVDTLEQLTALGSTLGPRTRALLEL